MVEFIINLLPFGCGVFAGYVIAVIQNGGPLGR